MDTNGFTCDQNRSLHLQCSQHSKNLGGDKGSVSLKVPATSTNDLYKYVTELMFLFFNFLFCIFFLFSWMIEILLNQRSTKSTEQAANKTTIRKHKNQFKVEKIFLKPGRSLSFSFFIYLFFQRRWCHFQLPGNLVLI